MKTEFAIAISQLSAERHLPKEVVLSVLESALASAYKREAFSPEQDISVKIDSEGKIKVYVQKVVAESVTNPYKEVSVVEARKLQGSAKIGEVVGIESTPKSAGRIAAQIARQAILQRLREAECHAIYEEFAGREGEVLTGIVQFIEPKQIYVGLGRTEAILPLSEQMPNERYRKGQRLKFYLLEVDRGSKGPQIVVSRSHPGLVRRLFELEVPEVHNGIVELKAVAREAGYRSKVAVSTRQEGVEPVGCCLGPRGIRIQNIVNEMNGEKIDIIQWHADPKVFVSNALNPAQVTGIEIDDEQKVASVVVPDRQLSLAIGKEGQNARLAARLTGWRIDIKSASAAEAEKIVPRELEIVAEEPVSAETPMPEPVSNIEVEEPTEPLAVSEIPSEKFKEKSEIRFAEEILPGKSKEQDKEKGKVKAKGRKKRAFYLKDEYEE